MQSTINFTVRNLSGQDAQLSMVADATITNVEACLIQSGFLEAGTDGAVNRFIFAGRQLVGPTKLCDAGISKNSVVHVVPVTISSLRVSAVSQEAAADRVMHFIVPRSTGILRTAADGSVHAMGEPTIDESCQWVEVRLGENQFKLRGIAGYLAFADGKLVGTATEDNAAIWTTTPAADDNVLLQSDQGKLAILPKGRAKNPQRVGVGVHAQFKLASTAEEASELRRAFDDRTAETKRSPRANRQGHVLRAMGLAAMSNYRAARTEQEAEQEAEQADDAPQEPESKLLELKPMPAESKPIPPAATNSSTGSNAPNPRTHFIVPYCGEGTLRSLPDGSVAGGGSFGLPARWSHEHEGDKILIKGLNGYLMLTADTVRCNASRDDATRFSIETAPSGDRKILSSPVGRLGIMDNGQIKAPSKTGRGRHAHFTFQPHPGAVKQAPKHKTTSEAETQNPGVASQNRWQHRWQARGQHPVTIRLHDKRAMHGINIKTKHADDIYRFPLTPGDGVYARLVAEVASRYQLDAALIRLQYQDSDGDKVHLENDQDLMHAAQVCRQTVVVFVTENADAAPKASAPAFPQAFADRSCRLQTSTGKFLTMSDDSKLTLADEPFAWTVVDVKDKQFRLKAPNGKMLRALRNRVDVRGGRGPWTLLEPVFANNGFVGLSAVKAQNTVIGATSNAVTTEATEADFFQVVADQ